MAEPVVLASGLRKTYGSGASAVEVLRGVDLRIEAGEFAAILGPSGSGKSTLLNMLGLMDRPDGGELLVRGRSAAALPEEQRSALRGGSIGFVFQFDSLLPEFSLLENVLMPARIAAARGGPPPDESRARALLASLGIERLADRRPAQMSGGERQRGSVARSLINKPALILADEPTGNLDRENGLKVFADFRRVCREQGAAVALVTHDEAAAKSADRVLRMADGVLR